MTFSDYVKVREEEAERSRKRMNAALWITARLFAVVFVCAVGAPVGYAHSLVVGRTLTIAALILAVPMLVAAVYAGYFFYCWNES